MQTIQKNISRRNFVKLSGMTGAALTLGFSIPVNGTEVEILNGVEANGKGIDLNAFITIHESGKVTITDHRSEMGQGSFQTVPQIIAEELEVNMNDITIIFGEGNFTRFGSQLTGGSSTVRSAYKHLCSVGASAREMLKEAAAKKWGVNTSECYAENGSIIHKPSGKKFHYGELVADASKLSPPKDVVLKKREEYKILRKPLPRQDAAIKTNGQAIFGIDKRIPGMLYAVVERSPKFISKVKSFDDTETRKIKGVKYVLKISVNVFNTTREGVAVVADNSWSAMQGRKALKVEWDDTGFESHSTEILYSKLKESLNTPGLVSKTKGTFDTVFSNAQKKVEAIYETPYQSHSCMEPLNCIAHYHDSKLEVWGPIQAPDVVKGEGPPWAAVMGNLASSMNMKPDDITVNMTFLGGGFGRKGFNDYPHEAAFISKEISAPVQVIWTREDDMTIGPFRPGGVYSCQASLNGSTIESLQAQMAIQNIFGQMSSEKGPNDSVVEGFPEPYFESISHYNFSDNDLDSHVPVIWWRSVYASTNAFAYESFIDEMALTAGEDPIEFRRKHLKDNRYAQLITKLEEVSGWKARKRKSGFGVAITFCFGTIVGEVVKVSKAAEGKLKIDKVWVVMDCGWYVNPDIIRQQVEGSIIMGLGAAVTHATHFKGGKAVEKNFDAYKMPRYADIPEIDVHVMENDEEPGGVGEPSLPPFAPALTNAIFDLTGKRIRKLPFKLEEV